MDNLGTASLSAILTGRTADHIVDISTPFKARVHKNVQPALLKLAKRATKAGFDLQVASSFRDFEAQLKIWNQKARGERQLLDAHGSPLEFKGLKPEEIVFAILRWSALPGASRHHWGTDIDVYDGKAVPPGYKIQLIPAEVDPGGMFAPLHEWLDENMEMDGFFRPYHADRGGVSPERWHLSYAPVAEEYLLEFTKDLLRDSIANSAMELKEVVLSNLDLIYERFITNIFQ